MFFTCRKHVQDDYRDYREHLLQQLREIHENQLYHCDLDQKQRIYV